MRYFDIDKAIELRSRGYTYKKIGDEFGVSKQYVFQKIGGDRKVICANIMYPNLKIWMENNRYTIRSLGSKIGITQYDLIRRKLIGKREFNKSEIDAILRVTGMSYEECFAT